jgi:hypothetical protein
VTLLEMGYDLPTALRAAAVISVAAVEIAYRILGGVDLSFPPGGGQPPVIAQLAGVAGCGSIRTLLTLRRIGPWWRLSTARSIARAGCRGIGYSRIGCGGPLRWKGSSTSRQLTAAAATVRTMDTTPVQPAIYGRSQRVIG